MGASPVSESAPWATCAGGLECHKEEKSHGHGSATPCHGPTHGSIRHDWANSMPRRRGGESCRQVARAGAPGHARPARVCHYAPSLSHDVQERTWRSERGGRGQAPCGRFTVRHLLRTPSRRWSALQNAGRPRPRPSVGVGCPTGTGWTDERDTAEVYVICRARPRPRAGSMSTSGWVEA
jgi:hypothetical protein